MNASRVGLVAGALAFAGLLATTTPFTPAADIVTAFALVAAVVVLAGRLARRGAVPVAGAPMTQEPVRGAALPWLVLLGVAVGWEFYCFFGGPRPAHPTLSTVYDLVARWPAAKAAIVLAWLALGWELLR